MFVLRSLVPRLYYRVLLLLHWNAFGSRSLWRKTISKVRMQGYIFIPSSSIEHGGTRPFFCMVDQYFGNDSLEPYGGTHNEAPKRKNAASLAL